MTSGPPNCHLEYKHMDNFFIQMHSFGDMLLLITVELSRGQWTYFSVICIKLLSILEHQFGGVDKLGGLW